MSTELEKRDRNLMAALSEVGIGPGSVLGLTFRLVTIDGMTPAAVASFLTISESTVYRRTERVHALLLGEADPGDPDDHDSSPLTAEARALLQALRNGEGRGVYANALAAGAIIDIEDARRIILAAEARRAARNL